MDDFQRGFCEELEKIEKSAQLGQLLWAVPGLGFMGYDVTKAVKEHAVKGERPGEIKAKSYFTKYPAVGTMMGAQTVPWGVGKGLEALGRRGGTPLHKAMSAGAGAIGAWQQMDPAVALQKGLGL